ncbi:MAG: copper amine oxidase N-terminal protein [Firmicutes bacterium]|nr:copper amine oxidase N-terminal protein [Bacillota bacterium]
MKNKKILIIAMLGILMLMQSMVAFAKPSVSKWTYEAQESGFSLTLWREGNKVWGSHSAWANNGNRCDSSMDEISIRGERSSQSGYVVHWKSGYSNATGLAYLTFRNDGTLLWRVSQVQENGERYIPDRAVLRPAR